MFLSRDFETFSQRLDSFPVEIRFPRILFGIQLFSGDGFARQTNKNKKIIKESKKKKVYIKVKSKPSHVGELSYCRIN